MRGPHTGFVEDLATNLTSIRKLIKSPNLVVKYFTLGEEMHTKVAITYMQNIANDDLVIEVKRRLETIKTDALMPPGYIQEFIEDTSFSPFPQQLNTERPDRTVANLMEGRVAILSDGDQQHSSFLLRYLLSINHQMIIITVGLSVLSSE